MKYIYHHYLTDIFVTIFYTNILNNDFDEVFILRNNSYDHDDDDVSSR